MVLVAACAPQGDAQTTSTGAVETTTTSTGGSSSATGEPDSTTVDPPPTTGATAEPPGTTGATTSEPDGTSTTGPTGTTGTTGATDPADTTGSTGADTTTGDTTGDTTTGDTTGGGDGVTWYRDVLPVAQVRCMGCHRDGGIASFTMEDVEVAQAFAAAMKEATATREMPPWMPDPDCQSFHDARILSDAEIALFAAWADGGALAGDPADAPPPVPPPALAQVDLELAPAAAYTPNKDLGDDDYRCLVLDPKLKQPQSLVGVHFLPDQADMVHHVVLFAVDRQTALNKDAQTPGLGWTCFGGPGAPGDALGAWVPGSPPLVYPQGTGLTLDSSDVIVMQMHYNFENIGDSDPKPDLTRVQLQYADGPVVAAKMIPIVDMNFAIPKNAIGYTHGAETTLQQGTRLYGMLPHMHKLGRKISLTSSALGCMINIPDWDFHWQQFYFFADPQGQLLPAKSKLALQCQWDNPGDQVVTWGEGTADEMCLAYIYTTPP